MNDLPLYQVIDWPENFETAKSKNYRMPTRVCFPNKAGGTGLSNVQGQPDGPAIYGIWAWLVQMCSRHAPPRDGWFTADGKKSGRRLAAAELANMFRCTREEVLRCLQIVQSPEVAFIRLVDGQPEHISGIPQGQHDIPVVSNNEQSPGDRPTDTTGIPRGHHGATTGNHTRIHDRKIDRKIDPLQSPKGDGEEIEPSVQTGIPQGYHGNSVVPQQETEGGLQDREAELWINSLFPGCTKHFSGEEQHLLSDVLPIALDTQRLITWAYALPRDKEGWSLYEGDDRESRTSKPKQSRLMLLREFGSECDKWRTVRAQLGLNGNFVETESIMPGDGWTKLRQVKFEKNWPGRARPKNFTKLGASVCRQLDEEAEPVSDPPSTDSGT